MPEDSSILHKRPFNGMAPESKESGMGMEELDRLIREWVKVILANIDPPSGLWKRIKRQAKNQENMEDSQNSTPSPDVY